MKELFSSDARILGLPIWRKRLTDAEYVERVRRNLRIYRWLRVLYGVAGIGVVCGLALIIQSLIGFLWEWGGQQAGPIVVFIGAILFGFNVGWIFTGFVHGAFLMIFESRRDRMLVECWDLLQQLIAERDVVAGGLATASSAGRND
ncbi:MAG: hypothetical protein WD971_14140 [Pirellulales bacterium]